MSDRAWLATRKGLIEIQRRGAGADWRIVHTAFLGEPVSMLLPPVAGSGPLAGLMLAALNLGHFGAKLQGSRDGGRSWAELPVPVYPPQPADAIGPSWNLRQIWTLAEARGTLWAGTLPGGLFRSDDAALSWQLVRSLWDRPERAEWFGGGYDVPGIHSICPHPAQAGELVLGVSCGGVWHSADDGRNWDLRTRGLDADYVPPERAQDGAIQDPHAIARCAAAPEVLWCQHHNGIWRSTDSAQTWHRLHAPRSSFGFAVAAHPRDPLTAWFAPGIADQCRVPVDGALVVNRTHDGGAHFDTLGEGLPGADCYDLVYRHGLVVADDARTLLMGSTTGGLWASADAGDHWATVSSTLPPIYAIRFG